MSEFSRAADLAASGTARWRCGRNGEDGVRDALLPGAGAMRAAVVCAVAPWGARHCSPTTSAAMLKVRRNSRPHRHVDRAAILVYISRIMHEMKALVTRSVNSRARRAPAIEAR